MINTTAFLITGLLMNGTAYIIQRLFTPLADVVSQGLILRRGLQSAANASGTVPFVPLAAQPQRG